MKDIGQEVAAVEAVLVYLPSQLVYIRPTLQILECGVACGTTLDFLPYVYFLQYDDQA